MAMPCLRTCARAKARLANSPAMMRFTIICGMLRRRCADASAKLNSNQGTAGKLFTDPDLYDNLTAMSGDLRLLIGDFRKDPKKFLHVKLAVF